MTAIAFRSRRLDFNAPQESDMTPSIRAAVIQARKAHPDRPIAVCYWDARRHAHFVERLSAQVAADKRRSKAAHKGWKTRRANNA